MSWIHTNVLDRFGDEFRIELAWMRQYAPDTPIPGWLFATRVGQMKSLLAEGIRSGEITIDCPSNEMLARAVIEVGWIPENILRDLGTQRRSSTSATPRCAAWPGVAVSSRHVCACGRTTSPTLLR